MRKLGLILAVMVGTSMYAAAATPNTPVAPAKASDSMQAPCPAAGAQCVMPGKGRFMEQGQWAGACCKGSPQGNGCGPMFGNGPGWRMHGAFGMHQHMFARAHKLFHAALLCILLVNILLTILVGLDMAKRGKFNGLWIPILLVAGIPGSMIYGIFRIGDVLAEPKKS